jgi:hypothetical protein
MMLIGRHWEDGTVLRAADAFQIVGQAKPSLENVGRCGPACRRSEFGLYPALFAPQYLGRPVDAFGGRIEPKRPLVRSINVPAAAT